MRPVSIPTVLVVSLTACWTQRTTPTVRAASLPVAATSSQPAESYQYANLAVAGVGIALLGAGSAVLARGGPDEVSAPLAITGAGLAMLGGPILHVVHGRGERALLGYLLRAATTSTGMLVGYAATCQDGDRFLCGLDGMYWGSVGGLALGAALDALLLHGREERGWAPAVTTSDGATRVGIAGTF